MPSPSSGPPKNTDLHGNVPDKSPVVVVVIDVINDLEFEGGENLAGPALAMARALAPLLERARAMRGYPSSTPTTTSAGGGRIFTPRSSTACMTTCAGGRSSASSIRASTITSC